MSGSFKPVASKQYRGVVVEENERTEVGIIFCKDIPEFITYKCFQEKCLKLGQTATFKCKRLDSGQRSGQLSASGAWQCSNVYQEGVTQQFFRPLVSAIISEETENLPLPFTKIGISEDFGPILIPRAHNFKAENKQRVIVQIQYCDFFIDGIFWVAIGWKSNTQNSTVRLFEPNLMFPEQSFYSYLSRKKPRVGESFNQRLKNGNTHGSNSNLSQASSTERKKNIAYRPECMLHFDKIEPHKLSAKPYLNHENHFLFVIKTNEAYKIGIIFPSATTYGIIPNTTPDPEGKATIGAFLEVSINQITTPNSPFQSVVRNIYGKDEHPCVVTHYEKDKFVVSVGLTDEHLDLRSLYPIANDVEEKVVQSPYWGPILFDRKSLDKVAEFEEKGFKFVVQHLFNHSSKAAWTAVPYKFGPNEMPTSSSASNDQNGNRQAKHDDSNEFAMDFQN